MTNTMTPSEIEPALDLVADLGMELIATQKKLKIATEALERIGTGDRNDFESAALMAFDKLMRATQALARIKEVGA